MNDLENGIINKSKRNTKLWPRQVDGILIIQARTAGQLNQFVTETNFLNDIRLTKSRGNETISYLELTIQTNYSQLKYDAYRKPAYTDFLTSNDLVSSQIENYRTLQLIPYLKTNTG